MSEPVADVPRESEPQAGRVVATSSRRSRLLRRSIQLGLAVVVTWLLLAYLILPFLWRHYENHPGLEDTPKTTLTAQGIPGDPLNVGLIGTRKELIGAMLDADWDPADPTR